MHSILSSKNEYIEPTSVIAKPFLKQKNGEFRTSFNSTIFSGDVQMKKISTLVALSFALLTQASYAQNNLAQPDWSFMRNAPTAAPSPIQNSKVATPSIAVSRDGWEHVIIPPCGNNINCNDRSRPAPYDWQERERQWQEREAYNRRLAENNQLVAQLVNNRQDTQIDQVYEGVRENKINREEFLALMVDQKAIRQLERSYTQDGTWTQDEFNNIMRELDKVEQKLRRFKQMGWN